MSQSHHIDVSTNGFGFQVRREKISERMKMLQKLVPGCDKVEQISLFHFMAFNFSLVETFRVSFCISDSFMWVWFENRLLEKLLCFKAENKLRKCSV